MLERLSRLSVTARVCLQQVWRDMLLQVWYKLVVQLVEDASQAPSDVTVQGASLAEPVTLCDSNIANLLSLILGKQQFTAI